MKNTLKLSFLTDTMDSVSINVPYPYVGLSDSEVAEAMAGIVASNAMIKAASLTKAESAELYTVTERKITM